MQLTSPWLSFPPLQHLFDIFEKEGATLRLVGGSVRDGLLDLPVTDIDLAVDRRPEWVLEFLKSKDIEAIPTGIEHGTITAVIDKRPYQITTLRVDVKTFGRKAEVAFTENWHQDALRRDFTINAIYADREGHLFDPVAGLEDLKNHRVRFIGKPAERIQEDYLRILRFFRFSARFGHEPYDKGGLEACTQYAPSLPHLARERITEEFLKILALPSPLYALEAMEKTKVLSSILHSFHLKPLKCLIDLEEKTNFPTCILLRLAALDPNLKETTTCLRLSNKQLKTLRFLLEDHASITAASFKSEAYRFTKDTVFQLAFLQTTRAISQNTLSFEEGGLFLNNLLHTFINWEVPPFPLTGADVLSHGVPEGEALGKVLQDVEEWWLSQDLEPNREACLQHLSTLLGRT